jgi:hypothetical protein
MLKEGKEDMEKVKKEKKKKNMKTPIEGKPKKKPNRNSGTAKYNN